MATEALFVSPSRLPLSATQKLSPAQSLAVVDIFINAAIACICHARELIPWDSPCFRTKYIDDLNSDSWRDGLQNYSAFCDAEPSVPSTRSQEFRILKRGEDKRADDILDLIETGVFAAVEGGFLEAVRFFVTQGGTDCNAADLLESYTLSFSYDHIYDTDRSVRRISINDSPVFNTDHAISSFKKAIKNLLANLRGLPLMPRRRSLGVAMLYNSKCPTNYATTGFLTEDIPSAEKRRSNWQQLLLRKTTDVGSFEVGTYRIVVGTSNVKSPLNTFTNSQMRDLKTSKQLQSLQKSSSQQRSGLISTLEDSGSRILSVTPAAGNLASDACNTVQHGQVSPDSSAKTSSQRRGKFGISATTVVTSRSRKRNVAVEKIAELVVQACAVNARNSGDPVFNAKDLGINEINRQKSAGGVRCECGDESQSDNLLTCRLCGTSQHVECYGWNGFATVRLPDEHFCYACLLLPREERLNAQMPSLVYKRLALGFLQANNPADASDLILAMHMSEFAVGDHEIFNAIVDELKHEGYLTRQGPAITAATDKESTAHGLRSYINPLARISHHFVAVKDGETERIRANALRVAMNDYTGGQAYLPDEENVCYSQVTAKDASGDTIQRWGFYEQSWRKRNASASPLPETPPAKKAAQAHLRESTPPAYQTTLAMKASYHEGTPPSSKSSVKRKASRCEVLVHLDRSSPSTVFSLDEALAEAVHVATAEVQWEQHSRRGRRRH